MSSSTSNSESSGAARPTGGATGGSRSSVVLRREQQIRAAALHLAEVNEEEHDAGESDCNSAATADNDDKYNHALTAPSGADGDEDEPDRKGKSGSPSDMQPHGSKKRSTPPSDVPPSPMVTPPIASQSAPRPQSTTSNTPMKPSPPSVGKKGSPAAAASPGSGTGSGGVPHVYHDYGHVPDEPGYVRKKTGGVTQPFPEKLYEMLESEGQLRGDVVEWLPHGRAFIVRRPKDFTDKIMPKYFRQSKLTSFQRQLNLYGFRRLTQGPDGGAYYHEMFLRGRPALCCRMKRQKVKGTGHKQPADANTEPNFYSFPPVASSAADSDVPVQQVYAMPSQEDRMLQAADGVVVGGHALATAAMPTVPLVATPPAAAVAAMSPGIASIHGAAHLLRRIASDERNTPFAGLPPSASTESPLTPFSTMPTATALWGSGQGSLESSSSPRGAYFLRQGGSPNSKDRTPGPTVPYPGPRSSTDHGFRC